MNLWKCEHAGCVRSVVGVGGAIGLRAIGWHFVPGGKITCPVHRPDPTPCREHSAYVEGLCPQCSAEAEAYRHQESIYAALGMEPGPKPLSLIDLES